MVTSAATGRRRRVRRRWVVLAAVLAGLLALATGGAGYAGWHYSEELLRVSREPDPYDLRVLATGPDEVTLPRTLTTERPGTYGLVWPDGRSRLGDVLRSDATSMTRRVAGALPPSGAVVRIATVPDDSDPRTAAGLDFREVAVPGPLGVLPTWRIGTGRPVAGGTWAIVVHGRGGTRVEALRIVPALRRAGVETLVPMYRNDDGAPPSPDRLYHLGDSEWRDIEAVVRYALEAGARDVVLVGYSMGGAIVLQLLDRSPLAGRVRAVVLDAPVLDWHRTLDLQADNRDLPRALTTVAEFVVSRRIGIDFDDFDQLRRGADLSVPVLLFHAAPDATVPVSGSDELAAARPDLVTYVRPSAGGHTQSWNVDPTGYERAVETFVARAAAGLRAAA